jgi:murein DD-endopeptidase MepM/ murein hydrolase activator NlpD
MRKRIAILLMALGLLFSGRPVSAQTATPVPGPVYIVQEGDSLWDIAARFNVSVDDIVLANGMASQDIFVGDRLIIPGLDGLGVSGILVTQPVPFGESLQSLSREYRMDPAILRKLNHIVSPAELYAGYNLVLLQQEQQAPLSARTSLAGGETLLELAVRGNTDAWTVASINDLAGPAAAMPGDLLYLPSEESGSKASGLPDAFHTAEVDPLPLIQGSTAQIKVTTAPAVTLSGTFGDNPLHFFADTTSPGPELTQLALEGINGMADPGLYPLRIDATMPDGSVQSFEQPVLVRAGNFLSEIINGVEPDTIDPAVTDPENEWLFSTVAPVTPEKYWQGIFQLPLDSDYCLKSFFGNRRSYNGGIFHAFHTGLDFGVCSPSHPFDVYAPADGVVVFTGLKTVRGNATIIDHGEGVYSGLYHQEEIYVSVGERVTAGQLIGKIGATGRVTGAHLHWDLFVNGVQVNPLNWLDETFPH